MKISKLIFTIILVAALSTSSLTQQCYAQGDRQPSGNTMVTLDVTPFFSSVDTNKDDSISTAEWKAAGLDESVFMIFDSEKKGSFSKDSMSKMSHPANMDANKDGKLSLDEFMDVIKNTDPQSGRQGGAPK